MNVRRSIPWVLTSLILLAQPASVWSQQRDFCDQIRAQEGSIAACEIEIGGNLIIGISNEKLADAISAIQKETLNSELGAELSSLIDQLSYEIGVRRSATERFLRILGEQDVSPEDLGAKLEEIAVRHKDLLSQLRAVRAGDSDVQRLREEVTDALDAGTYDLAEAKLLEARETIRAARGQLIAELEGESIAEASIEAEIGTLKQAQLCYLDAAGHFESAANLVPSSQNEMRARYLYWQANALYLQGRNRGSKDALQRARGLFEQILTILARESTPLEWAEIQRSLGDVLEGIGNHQTGTAPFKEAVARYRLAQEEITRELAPVAWASIQTDIGIVLEALSNREGNAERLREAMAAYDLALEELPRDREPLQWAFAQVNLGDVLISLGQREDRIDRFEEAIIRYQLALEEFTREHTPHRWALAKFNLASANVDIGIREDRDSLLHLALTDQRLAMEVISRVRRPRLWAAKQMELAVTLAVVGVAESGTTSLREAEARLRQTLEEYTRGSNPLSYATAKINLSIVLAFIGEREGEEALLIEGAAAFRDALDELHRERGLSQWNMTQVNSSKAGLPLQSFDGQANNHRSIGAILEDIERGSSVYV